MKKIIFCLFMSFILSGCQTNKNNQKPSNADEHFVSGKNTLIQSGLGEFSSIDGLVLDEQDREIMMQISPRTVNRIDRFEELTPGDIIKLSQGGINDDAVIRYLRDTNARYYLSRYQIKRMQKEGVSQRVINYMINTGKK